MNDITHTFPDVFVYEAGDGHKRPYAAIYKEPTTNSLVHILVDDDYQLATDRARFVVAYDPELLLSPADIPNFKPDSMIKELGASAHPQHKHWLAEIALSWGHPKGKRRKQILRDLKLP